MLSCCRCLRWRGRFSCSWHYVIQYTWCYKCLENQDHKASSSDAKNAHITCISWTNSYFFDTICKLCGFVPTRIFVQLVWCVQNARQVEWSTWNAVASMVMLHNCVSNKKESSVKPTACNLWTKPFLTVQARRFTYNVIIVACSRNVNTPSAALATWYHWYHYTGRQSFFFWGGGAI